MSDNNKYIPYSDEWKKEMMKWSKSDLIDFLRKQLRKINELENQKSKMSDNKTVPSAKEILQDILYGGASDALFNAIIEQTFTKQQFNLLL